MKRWPAFLAIALLSFLALNGSARADSFGSGVSWTVPTGGSDPAILPLPIGGIIWRPNSLFTFAIKGLSNVVDFFGSQGNASWDTYRWDFGDGNTAFMANATHAFSVSGLWQTFHVVYTHCNPLSCSSAEQAVTVFMWPLIVALTVGMSVFLAIAFVIQRANKTRKTLIKRGGIQATLERPRIDKRRIALVQRQIRRKVRKTASVQVRKWKRRL